MDFLQHFDTEITHVVKEIIFMEDKVCVTHIVITIAADDLVTQGAMASAVMVMTSLWIFQSRHQTNQVTAYGHIDLGQHWLR